MPKVIEGVLVQNDGLSRKRRKQEKARRKLAIKKEKERRDKLAFEGLKPSRVWGGTHDEAVANLQQSQATGHLVSNGRRRRKPSTAARTAYPSFIAPRTQTRLFLKNELDQRPDNNGRFALMAGHSLEVPPSTFISAFTTRPAADTACMLAYKKGDYLNIRVIDRGPDFHFETVVQHRRAV